jgi:stage II sporulation protein D
LNPLRIPATVLYAVLGAAIVLPAPPPGAAGLDRRTVAEPVVRIGITTNGVTAEFSSVGGIEVVGEDQAPVWKDVHTGDLFVVAEPPEGEVPAAERFVIQVASFSEKENAEEFAATLEHALGEAVSVKFHPASGGYRVRIGSFPDPESAFQEAERLRGQGYQELWVTEEPVKIRGAARLRLVDETYRSHLVDPGVLFLVPHRESAPVKVNGTAYRGILEVRIDPYGRLQVINLVNLEDYLRGVVPGEMGPAVYPELEALKAQAIAARTYIVRNLGQYGEIGFDICDTPRCQVYHGIDGEHPLTDRAIRETAGLVLEHRGEPINALYTSTCGGHTENVEGVFPQRKSAYLRGVPCYAE